VTAASQPPADSGSPDSGTGALVLTPPDPVTAVSPAKATSAVKLDPGTEAKLDATVSAFVQSLATADVHSPDFQKKIDSVSSLGDEDIRQSAQVSNRLLDKPAAAMSSGMFDPTSQVAGSLVKLRRTVEDLDPAKQGLLGDTERKLLGVIPFGNKLRDYSTSTSRVRPTSTRSFRRFTPARTSCVRTTPRSSRKRSTSGRSCSVCSSTTT
jgi:hypothetical protein